MKFLITITLSVILALALGTSDDEDNDGPCMQAQNPAGYSNFRKRHILPSDVDPNVADALRSHIRSIGRCNIPLQSFILNRDQGRVLKICNGKGKTLASRNYPGNLCISDNKILVYHVKVNTNCEITEVTRRRQPVIVACDKVLNGCLPVHYERYTGQKPGNIICRPQNEFD